MSFPDPQTTEEISPSQLKKIIDDSKDFLLIDCREDGEWQFNHIANARHFPLSRFADNGQHLLALSNRNMVIYCHHGIRSLHATRWLRSHGYTQVFSMSGGIHQWSNDIDSAVPIY